MGSPLDDHFRISLGCQNLNVMLGVLWMSKLGSLWDVNLMTCFRRLLDIKTWISLNYVQFWTCFRRSLDVQWTSFQKVFSSSIGCPILNIFGMSILGRAFGVHWMCKFRSLCDYQFWTCFRCLLDG